MIELIKYDINKLKTYYDNSKFEMKDGTDLETQKIVATNLKIHIENSSLKLKNQN